MDTVTYPQKEVTDFIAGNIVPLRVASDAMPLSKHFNVKWTPTLVVLDVAGKEHARTLGFLPPEEFIPTILLGMGKSCFDLDDFALAIEDFDRLIQPYPRSHSTPQAIYLQGVTRYKSTHDVGHLKKLYEKLRDEYPQSVWAQRAMPYRLL